MVAPGSTVQGYQPQTQSNKQTKTIKKMFTTIIPLSNRGFMARASGAEEPGKHDDIVLVLLVLTHSALELPVPK
jgi:hypothetical protein